MAGVDKAETPKMAHSILTDDDVCWLRSQLESLGAPLRGLGLSQLSSWLLKTRTSRARHYQREKREAASFLKTWAQKSQNILSTTFY